MLSSLRGAVPGSSRLHGVSSGNAPGITILVDVAQGSDLGITILADMISDNALDISRFQHCLPMPELSRLDLVNLAFANSLEVLDTVLRAHTTTKFCNFLAIAWI